MPEYGTWSPRTNLARALPARAGTESSFQVLGDPLQETVGPFLKKLNTDFPHGPAIPLLDIHPNEWNTENTKYICIM